MLNKTTGGRWWGLNSRLTGADPRITNHAAPRNVTLMMSRSKIFSFLFDATLRVQMQLATAELFKYTLTKTSFYRKYKFQWHLSTAMAKERRLLVCNDVCLMMTFKLCHIRPVGHKATLMFVYLNNILSHFRFRLWKRWWWYSAYQDVLQNRGLYEYRDRGFYSDYYRVKYDLYDHHDNSNDNNNYYDHQIAWSCDSV